MFEALNVLMSDIELTTPRDAKTGDHDVAAGHHAVLLLVRSSLEAALIENTTDRCYHPGGLAIEGESTGDRHVVDESRIDQA
jgi:hypothetical protein